MRFLRISPSTLDAFRRDVYRPRLALLLLILLLSRGASVTPKTNSVPRVQTSVAKSPATPIESWSSRFMAAPLAPLLAVLDQVPIFYVAKRAFNKITLEEAVLTPSSSSKAEPSEASPLQQQRQPGSLPKPSLRLLLASDVITVFLPLHLLWLVRLLAMAVEDKVAAPSFHSDGKKLNVTKLVHFHAVTLFNIFLLAALTVLAASAWLHDVLQAWALQHSSGMAPNVANQPLLPIRIIVCLEASLTLFSLLPALLKLSPALPIPRTLQLPSPSHSPALLECLLPFLPPGLLDALTGRSASRTAAARRTARRNRSLAAGPFRNHLAQQIQRRGEVDVDVVASASAAALSDTVPDATSNDEARRVEPHVAPGGGLVNSLTMQSAAALRAPTATPSSTTAPATSTAQPKRAPRVRGLYVRVETTWLVENALLLYARLVGSVIYCLITLDLPTLAPTSLPPVVALLSLHTELGHVTRIWSLARRNVECLEFVRRRWGVSGLAPPQLPPPAAAMVHVTANTATSTATDVSSATTAERARATSSTASKATTVTTTTTEMTRRRRGRVEPAWRSRSSEVICAICFEVVSSMPPMTCASRSTDAAQAVQDVDEACCLDCGHELHSLCLVRWLTKQAFCPTCHVVLSATPPSQREAAERAAARRRRRLAQPQEGLPTPTSVL